MAACYETYKYIHKQTFKHDPAQVMDNKYDSLDSLDGKFVVLGTNYRVYDAGSPYASTFLHDLEALPVSARVFHEVIFAKPQKLRFDIDADHDKLIPMVTPRCVTDETPETLELPQWDIDSYLDAYVEPSSFNYDHPDDNIDDVGVNDINDPPQTKPVYDNIDDVYQYVYTSIYDAICTAYFITYGNDLDPANIIVTESHGDNIKSNHIIIDKVYVSGYEQAAMFARRVFNYIPEDCRVFMDMSIYKSLQNFRIAGCHKGDLRVKRIITGHDAASTLITNTTGCVLLPDQAVEITKQAPKSGDLHPDDIATCLRMCADAGLLRYHRHRRTCGRILLFDRFAASYCDICNREHPIDNSLLIVVGDGVLFRECRRYNFHHGKDGKHFIIMGNFLSAVAGSAKNTDWAEKVITDHIANAIKANDDAKSATGTSTTVPTITPAKTTLMFREWPQHNYAEPQLRPFELVDTLVVHAAMKMGKTKALTDFITKHFTDTLQPKVIRIVSFRQTFSGNVKEKFPDFTLYSDVNGVLNQPRVIVQVESLWRLRINETPPDLLVLDECESIFEQFDSGLLRGNFNECFAKFQYMMKYSKHVVCMDAGLTNRTFRVLRVMRDHSDMLYHYNSYANAVDDNYYITSDKARWLGVLYSAVAEGDRIAVPMSSVTEAKTLEANLHKKYPNKRIKLYSAETLASEKREHFTDVNAYWSELDILIYTPTVSAGVSFERKHFNKIFGYFTDKSCPVETCVQMIGRIRDVASHEHYICINATGNTLPTTPEQVHERLVSSRENLRSMFDESHLAIVTKYDGSGRPCIQTTDYYQLYVENTIIKNISKNSFIKWFIHVVSHYGAKCHQLTEEVYAGATGIDLFIDGALNEEVETIQMEHSAVRSEIATAACEKIAQAADITGEEYEAIRINMSTGVDVPADQRAEFDKFRLRRAYEYRGEITSKFVAKYNTPHAKYVFKNIRRLESATVDGKINLAQIQQEELSMHEYLTEYDPLTEITRRYAYDKHRLALGLINICGWDNLGDPRQFHEIELSHKLRSSQLFTTTLLQACREFEIRQPKITNADVPALVNTINKVISAMYGARITRGHGQMYTLSCFVKP